MLRHIAQKDEDFIGKDKGGAKKLRNYDEGKVTKADEEKVFKLFANLFVKKLKERPSSNITEIKNEIKRELATETDLTSFNEEIADEGYGYEDGYNEYITKCFEGRFKERLISLYDNDPTLTKLTIDPSIDAWNGSMNVIAVSWALTYNTHLTKLDCIFNNTNDEGAKALGEMLRVNNTILELDLRYNHIGGGLAYLDEALKYNTSIIKIDLSGNGKIYRWAGGGTIDSLLASINKNRDRQGLSLLKTLD